MDYNSSSPDSGMFPNWGTLTPQEEENAWPPLVGNGKKFTEGTAAGLLSNLRSEVGETSSLSANLPTVLLYDFERERSDASRRLEDLGSGSSASTSSGTETGRPSPSLFGSFTFQNYKPDESYSTFEYMSQPSLPIRHEWSGGVGAERHSVSSASSSSIPNQSPSEFEWKQPSDNLWMAAGSSGFQSGTPKAKLNVFPERRINFTKCQIRFTVQATNIPVDVRLDSCKVEGLVLTPREKRLTCHIMEIKKTDAYRKDFFTGTFTSTEEVGLYNLRVRLILPLEHGLVGTEEDSLVIMEDAQILISKNYYKDSQIHSTLSFQLEFTPWYFPDNNGNRGRKGHPHFLSKAWGISCDKMTNNLYYTDRNGHSLTCLDPEGQTLFRLPRFLGNHKFNRPTGICCDEFNRRLIVADKDNHRVSIFTMEGQYLSSFGEMGHVNGSFNYPWDVAASPQGNKIAVTDSRNKRVQLFDREGNFLNKFSIFEKTPFEYKDHFDYPRGVTFNNEGTSIFVTDFKTNNIVEIPLDMSTYRKVLPPRKLYRPQGIVMDSLDNLLVCDSKNQCVRHLCPQDGQLLSQIQSVGLERIQFPVNVTLMADGRLAVLDSQGKVRIF